MNAVKDTYLGKQIKRSSQNMMIRLGIGMFLTLGCTGWLLLFTLQESWVVSLPWSQTISNICQKILFLPVGMFLAIGVLFSIHLYKCILLHQFPERHPDFQRLARVGNANDIATLLEQEYHDSISKQQFGSVLMTDSFLVYQNRFQTRFCLLQDMIQAQQKKEFIHILTVPLVAFFRIIGMILAGLVNYLLFLLRPMAYGIFLLGDGNQFRIREKQKDVEKILTILQGRGIQTILPHKQIDS